MIIAKKEEIKSLTGLRFLAAFYVFVFHIHIRWPISENPYIAGFFSQGAIGMSLFFILSGFILAYNYVDVDFKKPGEFKSYIVNRFARIYPVYILTLIMTFQFLDFSLNLKGVFFGLMMILISIVVLQAWYPQLFGFWNFGGTWSISVEIFLYSLLPFILKISKRLDFFKVISISLIIFIVSLVPGLMQKLSNPIPFAVYYATPIYRLPEFVIGVLILSIKPKKFKISWIFFYGALFFYIYYISKFHAVMPDYIGHNFITIPFISLIIYYCSNQRSLFSTVLESKLFYFLGKISYSFYLMQIVVILYAIKMKNELSNYFNGNIEIMFFLFALTLLMSTLSFKFIENPFRNKLRKILS